MERVHDYLILGAGPGGLQLAYLLSQAGRDYRVLEREASAGAFFRTFPRHRRLLSINKRYTGYEDPEINLRWDWNSLLDEPGAPRFTAYSADYLPDAGDLVRYLEDYAARHRLAIDYGAEVVEVDRRGDFVVSSADGRVWRARRLIVASGPGRPYRPPIPGIDAAQEYADVVTDPATFTDQRVLIIGKGNAAFELAESLTGHARAIHLCSPSSVRLAWKTHFVGNLRAVNNSLLDTYQLKSQNAVLDATIAAITVCDEGPRYAVSVVYSHAAGEREELRYDRVVSCAGWRFDDSIFAPACRPHLTRGASPSGADKYPAMTPAFESTNVAGLYFAGTLTAARGPSTTTSAFIHGFRYTAAALARILGARDHGEPWPSRALAAGVDAVGAAILARINRSSAIWQQFGYIGDVITLGDQARYYEDVPVDLADEVTAAAGPGPRLIVTLEYGEAAADPFAGPRIHREDADRARESRFLHPVVRLYGEGGALVDRHDVLEDLAAEWLEPVHSEPLRRFLARALGQA